jgi:hypothetical protein
MFTRHSLVALAIAFAGFAGIATADIEGNYYSAPGTAPVYGNPVGTRTDANIDFPWSLGAPGVGGLGVDSFAVIWRGQITIPTEGTWFFTTVCDDGSRLWIDGRIIVNNWVDQGPVPVEGSMFLTAGKHDIVMDFYENGGGAHAQLFWRGPGIGSNTIVPASALSLPQARNTGILGRYYFTAAGGPPVFGSMGASRIDNSINFGFGGDPILGGVGDPDRFAVRWVGKIFIPNSGSWVLSTYSDDGARLFIDTNADGNMEMIVDRWVNQGGTLVDSPTMLLGAGFYNIAMDFYEDGGGEVAQLQWRGPGIPASQVVPAAALARHDTGWLTEIHNTTDLSGPPVVVRNDSTISWDWGSGAPNALINIDNFSFRWRGKIRVPTTGTWTFYTQSDDGTDVYVNGIEIINDFGVPHGAPAPPGVAGNVFLEAGKNHYIEVRYQEGAGGASCVLRWSGPGVGVQIVPKEYVSPIWNEAPTNITLNPASIGDNQGANAVIGLLSTTDPDNESIGAQTHSYTLVPGTGSTHNSLFNINIAQLRQNNMLSAGNYSIRVRTTDDGILPDDLFFEKVLTVTVTDQTPPVITLTGGTVNVECGNAYTDPGYSAIDNVNGNITGNVVIGGQAVNTSVPGTYIVRYNVSDSAGNAAIERTRSVIVADTTPPVISLVGANPFNVECNTPYVDPGATATDACSGSLTASITKGGLPIDTSATGSHVVTYNVSDAAGNAAGQVTRTVNVVDTTAPVISLNGTSTIVMECGDSFTDPGATASDSCEGNLPVTVLGTVDTGNPNNYILTYNATDGTNAAIPVNRTVTVQDTLPPVITLNGSANMTVIKNQPFFDPGAVATDACEGNVAVVVGGDTVNTAVEGTYVITYNAQDSLGQPAPQRTRTVQVVLGNPPVITRTGPATVVVECGATYNDQGATAVDFEDGNLTSSIVTVNPVVTTTPGSYTVTYNVSDSSGNNATEVSRTVNVVDTTIPTIALAGLPTINIECGNSFTDPGATAADSCDGNLTGDLVVGGDTVDTSEADTYIITYNVMDSEGNAAVEVTRTVNVIDTTLPILTLNGSPTVSIECGDAYVDAGATAADTCADDSQLTDAIVRTGLPFDTTAVGPHVITYDVTDGAGNPALQVTRTVTVVDNLAPVITVNGPSIVAVQIGDTFTDPGVSALDDCEGDLPVVVGGDAVNTSQVGTYIITYNAQDSSGNAATQATRTVVVSVGLAPVVTRQPQAVTVNYNATAQFTVEGAGLGTLTYQWMRNGIDLTDGAKYSGTQTDTLSIANAANADEGNFSCELTSEGASVNSLAAPLTVNDPGILTQPLSQTVAPGANVQLSVVAAGSGTLTYQWYLDDQALTNGGNISGANSATLNLANVQENVDEGVYHVVVGGGADPAVQSEDALLQVGNPAITQQPQSVAVNPGVTVNFEVQAIGNPPLLYRWQKDGVPLNNGGRFSGVTTPTLTITNVQEGDEGDYKVRVVGQNTVESNIAVLTVNGPPVLSPVEVLPPNGIVARQNTALLSVVVLEGVAPLTFEWLKNGQPVSNGPNISGADTGKLEIISAETTDAGTYACRVTNAAGTVTSNSVTLKVGLQFTQNLVSQTVEEGANFQWTVRAVGGQNPLVYQWLKDDGTKTLQPLMDNGQLFGTDTENLSFLPVTAADEGLYVVEVTDGVDTVQSQTAALIVASELSVMGLLGLAALSSTLAAGGAALLRRKHK